MQYRRRWSTTKGTLCLSFPSPEVLELDTHFERALAPGTCFHRHRLRMRDLLWLLIHLVVTILRLFRPGGVRSVVAESVLLKHQLILNRGRRRAPNLRIWDRLIAGLCSLLVKPTRLVRTAIALKPTTFLNFHRVLVRRKYQLLFSPKQTTKPGPKGSGADVIRAVIEMKQRNRRGVVPVLPRRSIWRSALVSIRMSCDGFWPHITSRRRIAEGHPG